MVLEPRTKVWVPVKKSLVLSGVPFLEERIQPEEEEGRHRNRIGTNALGSTEEGREAPQRHLDPA
ncbi:hypothetical protein NGA_0235200, partial [Nannochloropsis gaditana CCMP526]|uniref:uncharacterized protein n=1 Tax=Nannochloropsis gaditana (strain CCMP526) TaxID=1093141 RepID=UPI00029F5865